MVNSGSFDSDGQGDRNAKAGLTQPHSAPDSTHSSSPVTASAATSCNTGFSQTADSGLPSVAHAIEPTPTKTEFNCDMPVENFTKLSSVDGGTEESSSPRATADEKASLCCSLPLEKIQGVLTSYHPPLAKPDDDGASKAKQPTRKLLCLYCDRSFVSSNLRQKHVERIHSVKQNRRVSSRRQNQLTATPCVYCDKLNGTENTLKDLFQHLINEHSSKYFGCLPCEDRFLTSSLLADHNAANHQSSFSQTTNLDSVPEKTTSKYLLSEVEPERETEEIPVKITRSRMKPKPEEDNKTKKPVAGTKKKSTKLKELRSKKLSVKSSRIALKRRESKRLQAIAKLTDTQKKKRPRPVEKKSSGQGKADQTNSTKSTEKIKTNPTCINPYPEFDHFYRVKKITDHSIDNLKISSLTFDDVFDKAFFNRIRCNIEENLLHHIDGKLFKNEESESRISNFEKVSNIPLEVQNANSENFGCELSLNAITPVAALSLNSQFGEDFESQIEYGSKPSKKKTQPRKDEIHYKYFTRRKYQASILEHKENRDLSKLDMWTQLVIKKRQQKMLDDKKSAKEILEYTSCDEYKNKVKRQELNRILDRRGPFEDLKEEASKKAALDKLNSVSEDNISEETFTEVREVLNEILNRVFGTTEEISLAVVAETSKTSSCSRKEDHREIPAYLNLRRSSSLPSDGEIDRSDKIALICSSQETENFELPTNQVRGKNELIELTGEWARCRMYICAACGAKLPNMRYLLEHKSLYHQNVWVQHYEFVGNQSELYRHLSIPTLGKVGAVENSVQCKVWKRSDARLCTKCGKQCNSLGELHRHILECGGDWTWMLARKKCKYRPFGAKSRRKRRGLIHRVHNKQKTEPTEKKTYKKTFEGPRQRPSDADTIQRMLANLPAKRSTRKLISLHDGIYRARKTTQSIKQNKVKCGKVIYKSSTRNETTEKTINTTTTVSKSQINSSSSRRSLRNLNKVLVSRILDTNSTLSVKRKIKALNNRRRTRQSPLESENSKEVVNDENLEQTLTTDSGSPSKAKPKVLKKDDVEPEDAQPLSKRSSPRSSPKNIKKKMSVKKLLTGKINIKTFFPVKKKKNRKILTENQNPQDVENAEIENSDIKTRSKRKLKEPREEKPEEKKNETVTVKIEQKKTKHETFSTLVRSFSLRKKKLAKKSIQNKSAEIPPNDVSKNPTSEKNDQIPLETDQELDKTAKKRKLKNSFRNVLNKVKKLKIDNVPQNIAKAEDLKSNPKTHKESAFLEESNPEGPSLPVQVEKVVTPSISEAKENMADISTTAPTAINFHDNNEDPPIPETIFKLELNNEKSLQAKGELDFDSQPVNKSNENNIEETTKTESLCKETDTAVQKTDTTQPISIETSLKPKIVPLISPNMKGKIRKPARGLNDCIAMLTSKLQQKTVSESTNKPDSIFSLLAPIKTPPTFRESYPPKTECILRIPTYRSHASYPATEETALDLSTKSMRNKETIETEKEPLQKPLDTYINPIVVKPSDLPQTELIVPTFDKKLNKVFNSVDQTIEDVVGNKIQTIIPPIQPRQWNSVDDIIQKVIDDQRLKIKLPIRNSVDDIIDFVVASTERIDNIAKETKSNINLDFLLNKETTIRKIGSVRKSKNKKSPVEILVETVKDINDTAPKVEKEPLESITTTKLDPPNTETPPTKSNSAKKKNKSQKHINHIQPIESKEIAVTPTPPSTAKVTDNVAELTEVLDNSLKVECQTVQPVTDTAPSSETNLNDAFIADINTDTIMQKSNPVKAKKGNRKVGQTRNRSRVKKAAETIIELEKKLIETNVDTLLDVKEVKLNFMLQYSANVCEGDKTLLTKSDEMKQLPNEDEPQLLENKPMTLPKPNPVASDSEDDIPLAVLVKCDEKSKSTDSNEVAETAIEKQDPNLESKSELKDCSNTEMPVNQNPEKQQVEDDGIKEGGVKSTANGSSNENKCINEVHVNKPEIGDAEEKNKKLEDITEQMNDLIHATLSSMKKILQHEATEIISDINPSKDLEGDVLKVCRNANNITSNVGDFHEDKLLQVLSVIKGKETAPISQPVEIQETLKKSNSSRKERKVISNSSSDQVQDKIISSAYNECAKNTGDLLEPISETEKPSLRKPNEQVTGSKVGEGIDDIIKHIAKLVPEPNCATKKLKNRIYAKTKLDNSTVSLSDSPLLDILTSTVKDKLTVQLKPLTKLDEQSYNISNFKINSEVNDLLDTVVSEKNMEEYTLESKLLDEFSPNTKVKPPKSKGKSEEDIEKHILELQSILSPLNEFSSKTNAKLQKSKELSEENIEGQTLNLKPILGPSAEFSSKPNSIGISEENIEHALELKQILDLSEEISPKTKTKPSKSKGKSKGAKILPTNCEQITKSKPIIVGLEMKLPNKEINTERDEDLLLEDDIPLKKLYENVCNRIAESNRISTESEDVDKEIENILFSPQVEAKSKSRASSSKNKNEKARVIDSISNEIIHTGYTEQEKKEKSKPKKSKGKQVEPKEIESISDTTETITDSSKQNLVDEANNIPFSNVRVSDEAVPICSEVSKKTQKEPKQPIMKNLEITLEIANSVFSLSNNTNDNLNEEIDQETGFVKPEIKTKKKRQSRCLSKEIPVSSNDDNSSKFEEDKISYVNEEPFECTLNESKIKSKRSIRSRSTSLKNKCTLNTSSILSEQTRTTDIALTSPNNDKKGHENFNGTLEDSGLNEMGLLGNVAPELELHDPALQPIVKRKVKQNKSFKKTSKKTKAKCKIPPTTQYQMDPKHLEGNTSVVEQTPIVAVIDLFVGSTNTSSMGKETTIGVPPTDLLIKESASENISNKINEEPPIKIIINKQKTRRKSKSFKKIDLKGQNDLFEDFALVIKKPKRVTPIIAFTPADTFSKDIYPNYLKKSIEEPTPPPQTDIENEDAEEIFAELDSSVEEMDMELDEIPITSNIIERNTKSFLPSVADVFSKTDVETIVETLNKLENNEEKNSKVENIIKDVPIEELFLPPEKDLALPTEAEVEEFLYETDTKSTRSKDNEKQDSDECRVDSDDKNKTLEEFYVQDLTKLGFISDNVNGTNEDAIVPSLIVSTEENDSDKPGDNVETLINSCDTQNTDESKINIKKSVSKKKKSKNGKNAKGKIKVFNIKPEKVDAEQLSSTLAPMPAPNVDDIEDKRKRSKSTTITEVNPTEASESVNCSLNGLGEESKKLKDADSIYAFSESEDFEIEKPIEKPKRPSRKQTKSLSESICTAPNDSIVQNSLPIYDTTPEQHQKDSIDADKEPEITKSSPIRRKPKCNVSAERSIIGEIKENNVNMPEEGRKSVRSAKVKALEHIHDDALAELTESERNRGLEKEKNSTTNAATDELTKKRNSRRQSRSQKSQVILEDLKQPCDPVKISDDNQDCQEMNTVGNVNELKIDEDKTVENYRAALELEPILNKTLQQIEDGSNQLAKKKNTKKTKATKAQKAKKTIDIFQISNEEAEGSFLLQDIASNLTGLEELENSIEKELNADPEMSKISEELKNKPKQIEPLEEKIHEPIAEENENTDLPVEDNSQELRRSRRGSRKIASYNENDLIDPLLDEIDGKKKIRKKEKAVIEELESQKKMKELENKLNSEELFDLLKATSNEKNCGPKPLQTTVCTNAENFPEDFNEHDFNNAFESILDGADKSKGETSVENIYEFTDSPENIQQLKDSILTLDIGRKQNKKGARSVQAKSQIDESSDLVSVNAPGPDNKIQDILELSTDSKTKSFKNDKARSRNKSNYCEICNKKFMRTDNLVKHKRTLTHIQKLSEIEAKEAAQKSQPDESANNSSKTSNSVIEITSDSSKVTENLSKSDINIHDILQESNKPNRQEPATDHTAFPNNHSLKLADIINDVLNKPVLEGDNDKHNSFSDIIMQNNGDIQPEYRRYKSLGERKSFDSEPVDARPVSIPEPYVSKTTILEKQISLLENIIENQTGVNYIDDISMSSNNSLENNALVSPSELSLKQDDSNTYSRINLTKPNTSDESFLKPSQYEEISEDSVNLRSYEDQKLRKTLNRDEELFLECCSLLKSGSEMSSYSNKKSQNKVLNTMGLKQCDEPEWLERKSLVEKPLYDVGNEYSDNSRIPTPLGDSYDDDASNSNTITSNWNISKKVNVFEDISQDKEDEADKSFSFQEILNEDEDEKEENISKFGEILSKTIGALPKVIKGTSTTPMEESSGKRQDELSDGSISEGKKIITKGARKVFEGLKVSIPTEELNLEEVLNCSPKSKKLDIVTIQNSAERSPEQSLSSAKPPRTARKSKPVKNKSQFGSNLLFKMKKKKVMSPTSTKNKNDEAKTHDIYDFEETQDNTDVFTKPDFRAFRNMKCSEALPEPESDTDSRDYIDSFSYEGQSITSSISSTSSKKPKTQENITKKKCMIMGRIFKNAAAKSKIEDIDEEIRDIPALDNCELVENYVADCKKIIKNEVVAKPKLSEKEINQIFDQLLEDKFNASDVKNMENKTCTKPKTDVAKKTENKKKPKPKNKKRTRTNSDSTDDEFSLNKCSKKRAYRKNAKAEDNCINLEQELKECIGVASRKSQRKCTSGKQNVLVEYWSSDDSQFEALLETQRIEVKQPAKAADMEKPIEPEPTPKLPVIVETNSEPLNEVLDTNSFEKCTEKKLQQKRKLSSEKKSKPTAPSTEKTSDSTVSNRRKRAAVNPLYHWSSSSEDESQDLIEVKPLREELEDDEDRPIQHGWIVGDSPKKLVTMLAQAKGKKTDIDCVKEQSKKRTNAVS